jgi:hypothetical protein
MNLDPTFYPRAGAINWLSHCGEARRPAFDFPVNWIDDRTTALQLFFSRQTANAMTAGQGALTGFLAKTDSDAYGTSWGRLALESRKLVESAIGTRLLEAVKVGGWAESLSRTPLTEIDARVRSALGVQLSDLLRRKAWEQCLSFPIIVNTNRAALEITFRRKFPKAPMFFERLLQVYEVGRLPCGWEGKLEQWPSGRLVIH